MFRWLHIPFLSRKSRKQSEPAPGPAPVPFLKKVKIIVVTALITTILNVMVVGGALLWLYFQPLTFADPFLRTGTYESLAAIEYGGEYLLVLRDEAGRLALHSVPADSGVRGIGHWLEVKRQGSLKYVIAATPPAKMVCRRQKSVLPTDLPPIQEVPYEQ